MYFIVSSRSAAYRAWMFGTPGATGVWADENTRQLPERALGVLSAFQFDVDAMFGSACVEQPATLLGAFGALLCVLMWSLNSASPALEHKTDDGLLTPVIYDTNFVTAWVVTAFLVYEVGVYFTGVELAAVFQLWAPLLPLIGVLVGLLPGCGPQIVVTSLYLSGAAPLSAQLGNALSNDGDALLPALALAPKAAVVATLYSALPALLVGYGYYLLWE